MAAVPATANSAQVNGPCSLSAGQYPAGATREQLSGLTGYKRSSRDAYVQRLKSKGLVEPVAGGVVRITDAGVAALGDDFEPLPTGKALRNYWLERLSGGEREILAMRAGVANPALGSRSA
ncbi:MAG: hypothetical protein U5P41_07090 [Gammaproteobacteria bacterium]|nr:hypothetical protein [Gammaproteobacteria bacterium]